MPSSTKNTKANRKVVVAAYYSPESVFKLPHGLDLEDTDVVEWWTVKYNCLHIKYVGIDQIEDVEPVWDAMESCDLKHPSKCTIEDVDVVGYEYTDDEDSEEEEEESPAADEEYELCNECETDICLEDEDFRTQAEFDYLVPDGHYCEECSAKMDAEYEEATKCLKCMCCRGCGLNKRPDQRNLLAPWGWLTCRRWTGTSNT